VAELYKPKVFENNKKSGGYWFKKKSSTIHLEEDFLIRNEIISYAEP
jgi:hypothetical protein